MLACFQDIAFPNSRQKVRFAEFRLLDARFIKMSKDGVDGMKLPMTTGLY